MRLSLVWYSKRIADALGERSLRTYVQVFRFGNADLSGGPMRKQGGGPAWLQSSLMISPLEQVQFLSRMVEADLPVASEAITRAKSLLESHTVHGWTIRGKTGTTFVRDADSKGGAPVSIGWYVGCAEKGGHSLAFASLLEEPAPRLAAAGVLARRHLLRTWTDILQRLGY